METTSYWEEMVMAIAAEQAANEERREEAGHD